MDTIKKLFGKLNLLKLQWETEFEDDFVLLKANRELNLENEQEKDIYFSLKSKGFIDDDRQISFEIPYMDIYKLYYEQDENNPDELNYNEPVDDYLSFGLPHIYDSTIDIRNEGNYLIDKSVSYSYEFEKGNYRRKGKSAVLFDRNAIEKHDFYRLIPPVMYQLLKELDEYDGKTEMKENTTDQFALLSQIKEYEKDVAITLCPRLKNEPKPVIIDKISIEIMDDGESLSVIPVFCDNQMTNSLLRQNCYLSKDIKDFYSPSKGDFKGVKFIVRNKEILEKIRTECAGLKGEERLEFLKQGALFFADWDEDIEKKIDLSLYSDRVVGIGFLDYKKGLSINEPTNLNWSEKDKEYYFPTLKIDNFKTTLDPNKHLDYFSIKEYELKKDNKNEIELELKSDKGETFTKIISAEDLKSEKTKILNSIISPKHIQSIEVLEDLIEHYPSYKSLDYIPLPQYGVYLRNMDGQERLELALNDLLQRKEKQKIKSEDRVTTSKEEGLIIKENEDEMEHEETPNIPKQVPFEIPGLLKKNVKLMKHQEAAIHKFQEIWRGTKTEKGFMLCDDMGLGKTLQILTFMAWLKEQTKESIDSLIVAPSLLLRTWKDEIKKFFLPDTFKIKTLNRKLKDKSELNEFDIVLMTYDRLRIDSVELGKKKWKIFICDEAQFIKEPKILTTIAAKGQQADFKFVCTATPIENSLKDLWNLVDFCKPGKLGYLNEFRNEYIKPLNNSEPEVKKEINEKLKQSLDSIYLRREKEALKKLPPKHIKVYKVKASNNEKDRIELYYRLGNVPLGKLKKMIWSCAHPNLEIQKNKNKIESSKLRVLGKILSNIKKAKEKALIFIESREIQKRVAQFIFGSFNKNVEILNGDTKKNKNSIIQTFRNSKGFDVVILSPLVAGFGLTLTEANHVIHYTRMWNPAKEDQATDRTYRIGQDKKVTVHLPILTFGDDNEYEYKSVEDWIEGSQTEIGNYKEILTPEEKLNILLTRKKKLLLDFFFAGCQEAFSNVTVKDFIELESGVKKGETQIFFEHLKNEQIKSFLFESLIACLYEKAGLKAILTPKANDHGIDVIVLDEDKKEAFLIQCKSGIPHLKEVNEKMNKGISEYYEQKLTGYKLIKIITSPELSREYYKDVRILNAEKLKNFLSKFKITYQDIVKRNENREEFMVSA